MVNFWIIITCLAVPFLILSLVLRGRGRYFCIFLLVGQLAVVCATIINSSVVLFYDDYAMQTIIVSPLVEEFFKCVPILIAYFIGRNAFEDVLSCALIIGVTFGFVENCYVVLINIDEISYIDALMRTFGAGLLHSICCLIFLLIINFFLITKNPLFIVMISFGAYLVACSIHSIFNTLIFYNLEICGYSLIYIIGIYCIVHPLGYERKFVSNKENLIDKILE